MKKQEVKDIQGVYEEGRIIAEVGSRVLLPLAIIDRNPNQPRKHFNEDTIWGMAKTYRANGDVDIPIAVSISPDKKRATIVYGERRYRAGLMAELFCISCFIKEPMSEIQLFKQSLRENVLKENMSPVEEALAYKRIMDEKGLSVDEIAEEYGQNKFTVYEILGYLKLHPRIQNMVIHRKLDKGVAKRLTNYPIGHQLQLLVAVKEAKEKKGKPLTVIEALMIIRKNAESIGVTSRPGRGKKNKTHTELIASALYRGAISVAKYAKEFIELPKDQLANTNLDPSCAAIADQIGYLISKLKEAKRKIASVIN